MTKFLRLTEVFNHQHCNTIIIPVDEIRIISPSEKGSGDTYIKMKGDASIKPYFVKESMEQIWLMLNTDMIRAPGLLTAEEALNYYKLKDGT